MLRLTKIALRRKPPKIFLVNWNFNFQFTRKKYAKKRLYGKRIGFEFKYTDRPSTTKSMHIALQGLKLDHIALIYPGNTIFPFHEQMTAYGLETIASGDFLKALADKL